MGLEYQINNLLKKYDPHNKYSYSSAILDSGIIINFVKSNEELIKRLPDPDKSIVVANKGFVGDYVNSLNYFKKSQIYPVIKSHINQVYRIEDRLNKKKISPRIIIGFGGGVPIDVSKKLASLIKSKLLIIPTAPSHDGHISGNASLYENGLRKTKKAIQPSKVIVPLNLWETSADLKKSGRCDILANIVALQDLSLSISKKNYEVNPKYISYSLKAVDTLLKEEDLYDLAESLFLSGLAMKETSIYCSGSEHELERAFANSRVFRKKGFLHGQLAGLSSLICSKIYGLYADNLPDNLFFNNRLLFIELKEIFEKKEVYDYSLKPLNSLEEKEKKILLKDLKKVSEIRPERYNLWNEINSKNINWEEVLNESSINFN